MTTPKPPEQPPPEMQLIRRRRKALRLSYARAAALAGMSDTWWRYLETGHRVFRGTTYTEIAPAGTLARMAHAIGVTPRQLEQEGRSDAAAELAAMMEESARRNGHARAEAERMVSIMPGLSRSQQDKLIEAITRELRDAAGDGSDSK
jgi:transcriptional regulator with XRE-family HTH domain